MKKIAFITLCPLLVLAQETPKTKEPGHTDNNKFRQMYDLMATPNMYRTASGAPGPEYYQQQADYRIDVTLDDKNTRLSGTETVTYHNNAKEPLEYLWLQLDQNEKKPGSVTKIAGSTNADGAITVTRFAKKYMEKPFNGGYNIGYVKDAQGKPLPFTINETMMRIDLPQPLKHGETAVFSIKWDYNINNYMVDGGRSGYEQFPDGNRLYVLAQFYPRMCVYNDVEGWQNMQFWGQGEFALTFGNFDVNITVPADHVMEATGELLNRKDVFTAAQLQRYEQAKKTYDKPVVVVTQAEAEAAEKGFATSTKTWKWHAENVRDFGISTSRKFIYDCMAVKLATREAMAISLYPKEGNPLWGQYSTKVVAHTLKVYSEHTFDFPYPKAVSINAQDQGMEYPMICWNYGRPDANGKWDDQTYYGMVGVITHEVGHNFFPMIVNSDERQWTWMDEGLNSFVEFLAERDWDPKFPTRRGPANAIVPYMSGDQKFLEPIMTNSESITQFGNNAYGKPAAALNILRETVMGRELFDYAFKTYANRWKFKHPTPEDFFRTMEDASGADLDWFWRGWFYTTDFNDIGIKEVKQYFVSTEAPKGATRPASYRGNRNNPDDPLLYMVADDSPAFSPSMKKKFEVADVKPLSDFLQSHYSDAERAQLDHPKYFYQVTFDKPGGLVMPLLVELTFDDGTVQDFKFPAQIWQRDDTKCTRMFATEKPVTRIQIDPKEETADIDTSNNTWPKQETKSKFD